MQLPGIRGETPRNAAARPAAASSPGPARWSGGVLVLDHHVEAVTARASRCRRGPPPCRRSRPSRAGLSGWVPVLGGGCVAPRRAQSARAASVMLPASSTARARAAPATREGTPADCPAAPEALRGNAKVPARSWSVPAAMTARTASSRPGAAPATGRLPGAPAGSRRRRNGADSRPGLAGRHAQPQGDGLRARHRSGGRAGPCCRRTSRPAAPASPAP